MARFARSIAAGTLLLTVVLPACSDDDSPPTSADATSTTAPAGDRPADDTLQVLVTNDDGIAAPGIDAIVEALRQDDGIEVTVVAPAENQSGTGGSTTSGDLTVADATTASGFAGHAVRGYPADTIVWALERGGISFTPDLVVSGINQGQNIGPLTSVSGTVGAALAAAQRGVPALAVSQGLGNPPDYASGVKAALAWLAEHRDAIAAGKAPVEVTNVNVPTCTAGAARGPIEVPVATDATGRDMLGPSNCESTAEAPADDVDGLSNGYVTVSLIPAA